jgi:hypothetical protein
MFEIDVQYVNNKIIVHHDECHDDTNIISLENFLLWTPNLITINIEIKKYNSTNMNIELIRLLQQFPFKKFILSSFDKDVCRELFHSHYQVFYLISKVENYDESFVNICIHKKFLNILNYTNHEQVFVYHVHKNELQTLKSKYSYIKGWIIDF